MSSKDTPIHVVIIGGGMAGLSLAAFLQKASWHRLSKPHFTSTVYEYHTYEDAVPGPPGGFGVAPNGVAVFASGMNCSRNRRVVPECRF
jgi:2-polyprenyl-6-methoxyphenol hydroxylase-like FAD-dependent oxidoreductase